MATTATPAFSSHALVGQPPPDWAAVTVEALPSGSNPDPRLWAEQIFSIAHLPRPIGVLMGIRQVLVRLIGIPPAGRDVFAVAEVLGQEALIVQQERHLDFRCGVGVDAESGLLWVTTAVWLHGWRGRLYFAPVAVAHDPITRAMMRAAIRRLG